MGPRSLVLVRGVRLLLVAAALAALLAVALPVAFLALAERGALPVLVAASPGRAPARALPGPTRARTRQAPLELPRASNDELLGRSSKYRAASQLPLSRIERSITFMRWAARSAARRVRPRARWSSKALSVNISRLLRCFMSVYFARSTRR